MNLEGIKWGNLSEETQEWLLEESNYTDGTTGNNIKVCKGVQDCIIDLTDDLSVSGKIASNDGIGYSISVLDDAIIYNPENGVVTEAVENINFEINDVLTMNEAAEMWNITEGAIRFSIKSRKFILGVDYRKAGRITLITKDAMERVYGKL